MKRGSFEDAFATWVRRLGLGGVSFDVLLAGRADDMPTQDASALGNASSSRHARSASVAIKVPVSVLGEGQSRPSVVAPNGVYDLEATIVHELLHVLFRQCGFADDDENTRDSEEQAVSVLERTLLEHARVLDLDDGFELGVGRATYAPWLDRGRWRWLHWTDERPVS